MYKQCNFFYIVGADELNSYIKFFFLDGKKKEKKKKRVKFAEDVVEPSGNSEEYRKLHCNNNFSHENGYEAASSSSSNSDSNALKKSGKVQEMPANRVALYNSMLKGRVINRVTYSY